MHPDVCVATGPCPAMPVKLIKTYAHTHMCTAQPHTHTLGASFHCPIYEWGDDACVHTQISKFTQIQKTHRGKVTCKSLEKPWRQLEWKQIVNKDFRKRGLGWQCLAPWISSRVQDALNAGDKLLNNQRSLTKQTECLARMRGDLSGSQVELWQDKCVSRCTHVNYVLSTTQFVFFCITIKALRLQNKHDLTTENHQITFLVLSS